MVRLFLITFLLVFFYGKSYSQSRGEEARFTDTLQICIADSAVTISGNDARLEFTIYLKRTNANWNNGDSILGMSDLCFTYNPNSFVINSSGNLTTNLIKANDSLFVEGAPNQDSECKMDIKVGTLAGLLHVGITPRNIENPGGVYTRELKLPKDSAVFICRIGVVLKTEGGAQPTHLGVQWDRPATGLMTVGGNPINEIIKGNVEVNPKPGLNIEFITETPLTVCEGDVAELVVRGESTGNALHYIWQDSENNGGEWHSIDTADGTKLGRTHAGHGYTYDLLGHGDTMRIYRTPGEIDSLYFRCIAEDLTVPLVGQKISPSLQLIVRDSIYGFLSHNSNILLPNRVDTVGKCPEIKSVKVRFNFIGLTTNEVTNGVDSVFFDYNYEKDPGNMKRDTVGFSTKDILPNNSLINGMRVYSWEGPIEKQGTYYLMNIWAKYQNGISCSNGRTLPVYDTLYMREDFNQILSSKSLAVNSNIKVDIKGELEFSGRPTFTNNKKLGTIAFSAGDWPTLYTSKTIPGIDTVVYRFTSEGGKEICSAIREIEIVDSRYLALKVLLEGAYRGKNNGRDSMRPMYAYFPTMAVPGSTKYVSPYDATYTVALDRVAKFPNGKICDWIYIRLAEASTLADGRVVPGKYFYSTSAFLRQDGVVCDSLGNPYITIKNPEYTTAVVVVVHRNHMMIASAKSQLLATTSNKAVSSNLDLSVLTNVCKKPSARKEPLKEKDGAMAMYQGSLMGLDDQNGNPFPDGEQGPNPPLPGFTITHNLRQNMLIGVAEMNKVMFNRQMKLGYYISDVSFDRAVDIYDMSFVRVNMGIERQF